MVATVMVNIALQCSATDVSSQTISVDCNPVPVSEDTIWELNPTCSECFKAVRDRHLRYYQFQEDLWNRGTMAPKVVKAIDSDFQNAISEFVACSVSNCKACVASDLSQQTIIKSVITCDAFNNVKNTISQQLMDSIEQKLTNNQDMLAPLAEMLGASTTNSVIQNLTNRITAKITDNLISNIQQQISSQQSITITTKDGTQDQQGTSQNSAFHSVLTYLQKNQIFNNVLSQQEYKILEDETNNQNTIGELGNTVVKSVQYLSKLLRTVVGRVVLFVLLMVAVIFVGVLLYIFTMLIKKAIKHQHDKDLENKEKAETLGAFQTF